MKKGHCGDMFELHCATGVSKAALHQLPFLRRFGRSGHRHLLLHQDQVGRELGCLPGERHFNHLPYRKS